MALAGIQEARATMESHLHSPSPRALRPRRPLSVDRSSERDEGPTAMLTRIGVSETMTIGSLSEARKRWRRRNHECKAFHLQGPLDDALVTAVLANPDFASIVSLSVDDLEGKLGGALVDAIRGGRLDHLRRLHLVSLENMAVLEAITDRLERLEVLHLTSVPVADAWFAQLLATGRLTSLTRLEIWGPRAPGDATVAALARGALPALDELVLYGVSLGDDAFVALSEGAVTPRLRELVCKVETDDTPRCTSRTRDAVHRIEACVPGRLFVSVEVEEPALVAPHEFAAESDETPSLERFRQLWAALEGDPSSIERVAASVAKWPAEARVPPPYTIQKLVDGRVPAAALRAAGGLRLFDLVLREETNVPVGWGEECDRRIARLGAWLGSLGDEAASVEILDLSPEAWRSKFRVTNGDLMSTRCAWTREVWSGIGKVFRGLRALNLSRSDLDYDVTSHDAYNDFAGFPAGHEDQLSVGSFLREAAFTPTLRELYLQGLSLGRAADIPELPALEVLDLSGREARQRALEVAEKTPHLRTLVLGGDALIASALADRWPSGDDEDDRRARGWLAHDHGIGDRDDLRRLLVSPSYVTAIRRAFPSLRTLVLGGEVKRRRVRAAKKGIKPEVRDARGGEDRRWLPW